MKECSTYVGLDAHKESVFVAMLAPGRSVVEWQLRNEPAAVRRLARRLQREGTGAIRCCYEAGLCGYTLQRQLGGHGLHCAVVAPSVIPVKPGERMKTDRRGAAELCEGLQRGFYRSVVHVPSPAISALRTALSRRRHFVRIQVAEVNAVKRLLRGAGHETGSRGHLRTDAHWARLRASPVVFADVSRFGSAKHAASYGGLVPSSASPGAALRDVYTAG